MKRKSDRNLKRTAGIVLLSTPIIGLLITLAMDIGITQTILMLGIGFSLTAAILLGLRLLDEGV